MVVTYDQAKFCLDADVRRGWAFIGETPIVYKNGSKESISIGGAYSSTKEFHFHEMEWQTKENVLWNLKLLRLKFPKMFLLLDKATWNKNKMVMGWMERENIPYMFFPTGASDLNPVEFCWKVTREEVTANESHNSKKELYDHLENFWRKHIFTHNVTNYLSP
ncbi:MAG TPA: transposase [Candidatus Nanoarchaeia archaeon]|nr:transposase [Candidatus Nanoarchaeia archaeon]